MYVKQIKVVVVVFSVMCNTTYWPVVGYFRGSVTQKFSRKSDFTKESAFAVAVYYGRPPVLCPVVQNVLSKTFGYFSLLEPLINRFSFCTKL